MKRLSVIILLCLVLGGGGAAFYHYQTKEVVRFVKVTCLPEQQRFELEAIDKRVPDQQVYVDNLPADVMQQMKDGSLYLVKDAEFTTISDKAVSQITAECTWGEEDFNIIAQYMTGLYPKGSQIIRGAKGTINISSSNKEIASISCWHGGCKDGIGYGQEFGSGAVLLKINKTHLSICQDKENHNCANYLLTELIKSPFRGGLVPVIK